MNLSLQRDPNHNEPWSLQGLLGCSLNWSSLWRETFYRLAHYQISQSYSASQNILFSLGALYKSCILCNQWMSDVLNYMLSLRKGFEEPYMYAYTARSAVILCVYLGQSQVENEHYSVVYFDCVTVFKALYLLRVGLICAT